MTEICWTHDWISNLYLFYVLFFFFSQHWFFSPFWCLLILQVFICKLIRVVLMKCLNKSQYELLNNFFWGFFTQKLLFFNVFAGIFCLQNAKILNNLIKKFAFYVCHYDGSCHIRDKRERKKSLYIIKWRAKNIST